MTPLPTLSAFLDVWDENKVLSYRVLGTAVFSDNGMLYVIELLLLQTFILLESNLDTLKISAFPFYKFQIHPRGK